MKKTICSVLIAFAAAAQGASTFSYNGGTYSQNFNSLPNPGATPVNTNNPVTIPATGGTTYTFTGATSNAIFDFAAAIDSSGTTSGSTGGLGLSSMSGWSGGGALSAKFGAHEGSQTTGGVVSFGPLTGTTSDRSLGLIATSTTGATYFGLAIINNTGAPISLMSTSFTWEFWKQGATNQKTVNFGYTVDNSNALNLISAAGSAVNLSNSPTETIGTSAGAVDGTNPANQAAYNSGATTLNTALQPGKTLWLTWQMTNAGSSGQGFGVDNFTFQSVPEPSTVVAMIVGGGLLLAAQRLRRRKW